MIRHISLSLGIVMVVLSIHAEPAWAQGAPNRAFKGLFGGNERRTAETRQTLDFTTDIQGGHDDNVLAAGEASQLFDPRYQVAGDYASSNMALAYVTGTSGRAITFSGRASGDFRYAPPAVQALSEPRYDGAVGIGLEKTLGIMTVTARQSATYAPFRMLTAFPRFNAEEGIPVTVMRDFAISSYDVYGLNSEGRLGFKLGRRSSFDVAYRRSMTDYSAFNDQILDQNLGGAYSYRISRNATLRLGYAYRLASYSGATSNKPVASQNIDAGVDYSKPLSISRKTSVVFNSGSASASNGQHMQYFATGGAGLNQDIGRSWSARLMFSRSLSFLDGFSSPFLQNGVSSEVGGYIGRRFDMVFTGAYADADSTQSVVRSRFTTYTGASRVRLALTRYASVYGQYFYYQYRFRDVGSEMQGLPPRMERRGFRAGLTMWLPLLR